MIDNNQDLTVARNYIQKYHFLIFEYELVKKKVHLKYQLVKDFYATNTTDMRNSFKYYNQFKQIRKTEDL
jgi:hypothetical protein